MTNLDELLEWNQKGLIPGPDESEENYLHRVSLSLKASQESRVNGSLVELYDIHPRWVTTLYSDQGLRIWHGGGTLLEEIEGHRVPTIQLRRSMKNKESYLGLYRVDELIDHELVHAGRITFDEPQFEEILAYQTSRSRWRRFLGPLVQSGQEAWLFVLSLFLAVAVDYVLLLTGRFDVTRWTWTLYLAPLALATCAVVRLLRSRRSLSCCLKRLRTLAGKHARAIAYRLTDREIVDFSSWDLSRIRSYASAQDSLRWRVIKAAYLSE